MGFTGERMNSSETTPMTHAIKRDGTV